MNGQPYNSKGGREVAQLVAEYWDHVRHVCQHHLAQPSDVDDAVQETFARFLVADQSRITNVSAWLALVADRVCFRILRHRYEHPEETVEFPDEYMFTGDFDDDALDGEWVRELTAGLLPADANILIWLYVQQIPRPVVAGHLGVTPAHLRVLAYRARQRARGVAEQFRTPWEL
jgi:RNA polymerase sigma factor (sigma-70 family)